MDIIKIRDKFTRLSMPLRNQLLTDTIAWLESDERPKCKADHLQHLINFENELQGLLNQPKLQEQWFVQVAQTYGSFPFYERFVRRVL
jgi:hypothetical protein